MIIAGIQTLTLLDFPGRVAAMVFTAGCNFRCGFCHNPQFVDPDQIKKLAPSFIPEEKFFSFLETRKNFLEGVVISGGEPTVQSDLIDFLEKICAMGFLIKLDTNGTNPEVLEKILTIKSSYNTPLVDYFAMDIKASSENFEKIAQPTDRYLWQKLKRSKDLILNSTIDHEFRTTVIQEFHDETEILKIAEFCRGAKKFTIQNFRPQKTLDANFRNFLGFDASKLEKFKKIVEKFVEKVEICY